MRPKKYGEKVILGWYEHVDLPKWGVRGLRAKIDTGARTSSMDVDHIHLLDSETVRFGIVLSNHDGQRKIITVTEKITRRSHVKSSPATSEERYFVKTLMRIGEIEKEIEINLFDRSNMLYRMLLGRSALKKDFLVDPGRSKVQG